MTNNDSSTLDLVVDLQVVCAEKNDIPSPEQFDNWVRLTLIKGGYQGAEAELTIRIVDDEEITQLNTQYRNKNKATNVLSFPFEQPVGFELPLLGDIIVCKQVMVKEAKEQQKRLMHHWAHLIIHGTLHLLGYDHIDLAEAEEMESLEVQILTDLGIDDPY